MSIVLTSLFCDDVRVEVGNKLSAMGIYGDHLVVPEFPAQIHRLFAMLRLRSDEEFTKPIKLSVLLNDQVLAEAEITPLTSGPNEAAADQIATVAEDVQSYSIFNAVMPLDSLSFSGPALLRTRAEIDGETFRGEGLVIVAGKRDVVSPS